jgi:hypothetical protein
MAVTPTFGFPYPLPSDLVRDGAENIKDLAEGVNDYLAGGYLYAGTIYYTSSGTFAKADPLGTGDIGLRAVRVRLVGGGGGGGGAGTTGAGTSAAGGAGGGGGYSERFILASALSATETVTRGGGGPGGAAGNNNGVAGGTSSFGSLLSATGGGGGDGSAPVTAGIANGGAGGSGSTGDLNMDGERGSVGRVALGTVVSASQGGASILGYGGAPALSINSANGSLGLVYGGGGSGGLNRDTAGSVARSGAAGAAGIVIVDVFV